MSRLAMATQTWSKYGWAKHNVRARRAAQQLYGQAYARGQLRRIWLTLTRRSYRLLNLAEVEAACNVQNSYYVGIQTVSIRQIRGSRGRWNDFDCDFYPLKDHNAERWLRVATARQQGVALPPITLIQVGEVYFVSDGHHRLSVATALGQQEIEAGVTVWQVSGLLSNESSTPTLTQPSNLHFGRAKKPTCFVDRFQM